MRRSRCTIDSVSSFVRKLTEASIRAAFDTTARSRVSISQLSVLYRQTAERVDRSRQQIHHSDEVISFSNYVWWKGDEPHILGSVSKQ
jgi:hypothetical protein